MSDPKQPSGEGKESVDDLWADAFNEQQSTEKSGASTEGVFKSLEAQDALGSLQDIDLIRYSGQADRGTGAHQDDHQRAAAPVARLGGGAGGSAGEPLDILINGYLIATR